MKSIYIILSCASLLFIVQCTAPSVDSGAGASKKAHTINEHLTQFSKQMRHQGKIKQKAKGLNQQIIKLSQQARYNEAIKTAKKVLTIYEKELGPDHPFVAEALDQLALLYETIGDYMNAELLRKNSLAIREEAFEADNPFVSVSLNNLALLYANLGDYERAERLYRRSFDILEEAFGTAHPQVALSLNNLAFLYLQLGDYTKAKPLFERSYEILEKAYGTNHLAVAISLNNLGVLYVEMGDYVGAEPLYRRSLEIREKALGPDHPDVGTSLNNLAGLYRAMGDYTRAEQLYNRSLEIWEKALGPDHPNVRISLNSLGLLYAGRSKFIEAHSLFVRSQMIDEKLIDQVLGFTSESQQALFLRTRQRHLEVALSLSAMHLREELSVRKDALDIWLRRKGVSLEAQRRFQEALIYSDDLLAMSTFQELARVRSGLSQLTFSGPGEEGAEAYRTMIAELEREKRDLESKLATLSQAYALKKKIERADSTRVAQALPENTALMEFVRINIFNFKAKGTKERWLPPRYITFVLHAGKGDRVEMIDLGDAEEIDKTVALFKTELGNSKDKEALKAAEASRRLHDLVFEPLKKALGDVKEVFISPDGNLNLIPFEVLQGPDGKFLIEDYTFNYLAAGRDILGFGEIQEQGARALIMGDPDFDMGTKETTTTLKRLALKEVREENVVKRSADMRGFRFSRLPGTRKEVEGIHALLGKDDSDIYTGKAALEEVLRSKGTPRILHLATHGFFLDDQDLPAPSDDFMERGLSIVGSTPVPTGKRVRTENPLLRSGIALAGANNALESEDPEKSDGIVTAEKILGLRLRGTDMVVLSACDTGIGEVRAGEGVYGLRRAFTQAGTRSLVMSMWPVPDKETKELMIEFYKNTLSGGMTRSQALRQAALKQKEIVQERYGTDNPLYWGGFVFMGEP
ncbi:MAG: CHAT domain-containing tetratricopeptide repeat protein [Desulfatiglandaceae bacterium]